VPQPPRSSLANLSPPRETVLTGAVYLALSAVFLADVVFTGKAYVLRDILTFFHPWQHAVRDAVRSGHLPLWNHDTLCGVPLLANLQSGVFYPLNWPFWVLPFDVALTLSMALHLTAAGLCAYLFARKVGAGTGGAFLGGALFAFGTWTLSYLEFPMKLGSAVWLPLLWLGAWEAIREGRLRGAAWGALAVALSVFSGYPQLTLLMLLSASILVLVLLAVTLRQREISVGGRLARLFAFPAILAIAALLSAAQLLPAAEMTALSAKAAAYDPAVALSRSLPPKGLLGLLDPFFFGFPGVERFWGGKISEYCFGAFYVGILALPLVFAAVAGAIRSGRAELGSRSIVLFLVLGTLLGIVLALGRNTPIYPWLHETVPGFGRSRWPATAGYLVAAHLAPLAGLGLTAALADRGRLRWTAGAALGLALLLGAAAVLARGPLADELRTLQLAGSPPFQVQAYEHFRTDWLATLLPRIALVALGGALGLLLTRAPRGTAVLWTALLLLDLFLAARTLAPASARGFYDRVPAPVARLRDDLAGKRIFTPRETDQLGNFLYGCRNLGAFEWAKRALLCNANVPAGIAQAHGCEPLSPRRHDAFTQAFAAESTPWQIKERIFDLWDAALLITAPEVEARPLMVPSLTEADDRLQHSRHEPRLGRATLLSGWKTFDDPLRLLSELLPQGATASAGRHDPLQSVFIESSAERAAPAERDRPATGNGEPLPVQEGPNSIRVAWQIGEPGMLRVLESWAPGWEAKINGAPAPVYRADFLFMAVPVSKGPCEVVLTYRPESVRRGLLLSVVGLLVVAALFFIPRRRNSPSRREGAPSAG
jgi:hypothetical protein